MMSVATPPPDWAVVTTLREPLPLVLAFAAHHLSIGASEVILYFDDADDPAADIVAALPGVRVIRCDADYWDRTFGRRPDLQTRRQRHNATRAYAETSASWLLHLDADEFLHLKRPLETDLARLDPEDGWLKINVAERVWVEGQSDGLFDGAFRSPVDDPSLVEKVYGARARLLNRGLAGHSVGKSLSATRRGFEVNIHSPLLPGTAKLPAGKEAWHARILHFDGLTPLHWAQKTLRYAALGAETVAMLQHDARADQVGHVERTGGDVSAALALHRSLMRLTLDQAAALDDAGALTYAHVDPVNALEALGIQPQPDLSPAAFDRALAGD